MITLMDITSQKQSQVILQNTEKRLSIAEQASDAKSDYLSRIAHEIRTPMSSLISLSKSAKRKAGNPDAIITDLDKIIDTVDYLATIVTDISEASISERLSNTQLAEPFALRAVLDNISAIMEPRAEEAQLRYEVSLDESFDPRYVGNKAKLQQILINFLNNSIKFTKPGGAVTLRAYEEPRQGERARVCFVVADTGIGIKKEYIPRLFKPFATDDADGKPAGLGLGLSIAYNLISSMQGDVSVESTEGEGSTFTIHVYLDRDLGELPPEEAEDGAPEGLREYDLAGCNVLIAEDNALNRTILGALLSNEGMTFVEAINGEEAVKAFTDAPAHTFDCILMDMRMPKLDGIRATVKIRESAKADARTVPIIGVSANGFADDIKKARQAGIDEYTTKPIERDSLLSAMDKLIKRR